jgi:hypothetical protein
MRSALSIEERAGVHRYVRFILLTALVVINTAIVASVFL